MSAKRKPNGGMVDVDVDGIPLSSDDLQLIIKLIIFLLLRAFSIYSLMICV
jgi:hypothetical protein